MTWSEVERAAPEIAAVGKRLLFRPDRGEVALLATVDRSGRPRIAPVCPIFAGPGVFLVVATKTPKARHLRHQGGFALHALVGADDEEFQISGRVRPVEQEAERRSVIEAIPFESFDPEDPIFELLIERALAVTWPAPGRSLERSWTADVPPE